MKITVRIPCNGKGSVCEGCPHGLILGWIQESELRVPDDLVLSVYCPAEKGKEVTKPVGSLPTHNSNFVNVEFTPSPGNLHHYDFLTSFGQLLVDKKSHHRREVAFQMILESDEA